MAEQPFYRTSGYSPVDILEDELRKARESGKKNATAKAKKRALDQAQTYAFFRDRWEDYVQKGYVQPEQWSVGQMSPEEWVAHIEQAATQGLNIENVRNAPAWYQALGRAYTALLGSLPVGKALAGQYKEKLGVEYSTGNPTADMLSDLTGGAAGAMITTKALAPFVGAALGKAFQAAPAIPQTLSSAPVIGKYAPQMVQRAITGPARVAVRNIGADNQSTAREYAASSVLGAVDAFVEPGTGELLAKWFPSISPYLQVPLSAATSSIVSGAAAVPVSGQSWREFMRGLGPDMLADALMSSLSLANPEERRQMFEDRTVRMTYEALKKVGYKPQEADAMVGSYAHTLNSLKSVENPDADTQAQAAAIREVQANAHHNIDSLGISEKLKKQLRTHIDERVTGTLKAIGMDADEIQTVAPETQAPAEAAQAEQAAAQETAPASKQPWEMARKEFYRANPEAVELAHQYGILSRSDDPAGRQTAQELESVREAWDHAYAVRRAIERGELSVDDADQLHGGIPANGEMARD